MLKPFKGYLQNDGYATYDAFESKEEVCLAGRLAHIRRHIETYMEENREHATQGLKLIQDWYNVEHMTDEQELINEKRAKLH